MSDVLNRTTGQFLKSVNTPDFDVADWIINPDLSAVTGQPPKYWIIDPPASDTVRLATGGEQTTIDDAIATAKSDSQKAVAKNNVDVERVVRALVELLPSEFNILRTLHSLPDRTEAQVNAALKANIDAQP